MDLTCPKCQGTMRTYERSGITVDQCTECRGIFLDRGELERLVDAENAFHGAAAAPAAAAPPPPSYGSPQDDREREYRDREYRDQEYRYKDDNDYRYKDDNDYRYKDRDYDDRHRYGDSYHHKKKKRSLFEELFD
jgi:Zn-finger nucleic acid-binding protein